jgi:hypothetical protein
VGNVKKFQCSECSGCCVGPTSPQLGTSSGCGWKEALQIYSVAASVLNKQLWIASKVMFFSMEVGQGAKNALL